MIAKFLDQTPVPHRSGIYIFQDISGRILYVGKAIDLNKRIRSYFNKTLTNTKTSELVKRINSVETLVVESELEALILEANLIKKYLPPFNIRLVDDKDYLYIKITKEDFPQVLTARKKDLKDVKRYFGPFPSSRTVRETLKSLRKIFPWCSNPPKYDPDSDSLVLKRPCFYFHLKLCPGACVGKISQDNYLRIINHLILFLEGKKRQLREDLEKEMARSSKNLEFERAAEFKKTITGMEYLTQPNRVESYLENPNFLQEENKLALRQVQQDLRLSKLPGRIEGYDISNIQGRLATGSMVVLTHGEIDKSQYRKFKIIISGKPNDIAMHKEMIRRRLNHPDWPISDLIIVDGGRGQVRAVHSELQAKNLDIPVFGLAKRMEWLYPAEGSIVKLPKRSLSLRLLQRLRDESHRFALNYHRRLRSKAMVI